MAKRKGYSPAVLDKAKIRDLRVAAGLTYQQAADAAGMKNRQQWNNVESDYGVKNLTLDMLDRIAKALDTSAKELLK